MIRTTDLLRAALQELEHGFRAEHTPVSDGMLTEVMFVFDLVGFVAAEDVVRYLHYFHECNITQLEPRAVSDGCRPTTPDPSNTLPTLPSKSFITIAVCGPRHISSADVTLHVTPNETHVLEKLNCQFHVSKKTREKILIRCTVFP
jgi:hypothetical protein